jgi:uncharacterized membrane-anchored protein
MNEDTQETIAKSSSESILETQVKDSQKNIPRWRFFLPLILQTGLIFSIPIQPFYTQITGKTVILKTIPVDPYDVLRGYSQTLNYDISTSSSLEKLSGWKELTSKYKNDRFNNNKNYDIPKGTKVYVILEAPKNTQSQPPQAWKPIAVSDSLPESLPENRIALLGKYKTDWRGGTIEYGLETYYLPEENIDRINRDINEARFGSKPQSVVLEAKIDSSGRAVPISFWIGKINYKY